MSHWSLLKREPFDTNPLEPAPVTTLIANHAGHLKDWQVHGDNEPADGYA
jgi:hypothetical protein